MAVFADAEEVYRYLAGIFRRGLENEDLANRLAGSGVVLRIHYTDP
ncbi:MAG TPA: sterol carrier protein, partial [Mycobacterium sp.]|nr:sterol carrier protein [Mycobacterium sp.]